MNSRGNLSKPVLWTLRIPLLVALGLSLYLLIKKLSGEISSLAGCGAASGCANLLGGKWSELFGVPVTGVASLLYVAALVATTPLLLDRKRQVATTILTTSATAAALAAAWFAFLMVKEGELCTYCTVIHIVGLTFSTVFFLKAGALFGNPNLAPGLFAGTAAVFALAMAQLVAPGPDTHSITEAPPELAPDVPVLVPPERLTPKPEPAPAPDTPEPETPAHLLRYVGGNITVDTTANPALGSPGAPHPLVKYFDYTCASCRDSHGDLHKLFETYPGQFRLYLLPCPLNEQCNAFTPAGVSQKHAGACELAELALAVFHTAPDKFPAFHEYLMRLPLPADVSVARAEAERLVPAADLDAGETKTFVSARLDANVADYAILKQQGIVFPKLLLNRDAILHGVANTTGAFVEAMRQRYELPPPSGGSGQ